MKEMRVAIEKKLPFNASDFETKVTAFEEEWCEGDDEKEGEVGREDEVII